MICRMDPDDVKERLGSIAKELLSIYEIISSDGEEFPEECYELLRSRVCLACKRPIEPQQRSIRGLHESCRKMLRLRILAGELTEMDAIKKGLLAPAGQAGRRVGEASKAIDEAVRRLSEQ